MLSKMKKPNQEGFTIIEVLIVLAIAGLILLIVFLAVPALQRSARNTERKTDASAILASVSEYSDNNAGTLPTALKFAAPTLTLCNATGCTGTDAQSQAKLGYYTGTAAAPTKGDVTIYGAYTAPPAALDALIIENGATCTSATAAGAGSTRATAVLYGIEASGGYVWQCTGS
jgi:prepilin-type N-terminal cleavage/methylation domain-containing protein